MDDPNHPDNIRYRAGTGNWNAFLASGFSPDHVYQAAEEWRQALSGVERPWLCWNVDPDWSLVQQRLVVSVGWTPVIGFDPRVGPPPLEPGAISIDFNEHFGFETMWPHFPLEFAFLFSERLAFWHADLLVRHEKLQNYSEVFRTLEDGALAAVLLSGRLKPLYDRSYRRYWELLGCTTRSASADQFAHGVGWWRNIAEHPNADASAGRSWRTRAYYDSGAGIWEWKRRFGGRVHPIPEAEVSEGHFTSINNENYVFLGDSSVRRNLGTDLRHNYDLGEACRNLGLSDFL